MTEQEIVTLAAKDFCMRKYYNPGMHKDTWDVLVNQTIKEIFDLDDEEYLHIMDLYQYRNNLDLYPCRNN